VPTQLKYVSEESTKLENWRASFLDALKGYGEKAMSRATFQVRMCSFTVSNTVTVLYCNNVLILLIVIVARSSCSAHCVDR
jgi:hypothetical protein